MLVICEECGKKYNIDVTKIKGKQAKFHCQQCNHLITVEKPLSERQDDLLLDERTREVKISAAATSAGEEQDEQASAGSLEHDFDTLTGASEDLGSFEASTAPESLQKKVTGIPVALYLFIAMAVGFLATIGAVTYPYFTYIPQTINHQVELRMQSMAASFASAVNRPLLQKDYLQINKEAEHISKSPDIAYAAVVNDRGIVVAGLFHDLADFTPDFAAIVKAKGFPQSLINQNRLAKNAQEQTRKLVVGGRQVIDTAMQIGEAEGEVHIGTYPYNITADIKKALISPKSLTLLGVISFCGLLLFLILVRAISVPLKELTQVVDRISVGELDLVIRPRGPREIRNLAMAFERMRYSFTMMSKRLKNIG